MPLPTFAMMKILVHTCNSMANDSLIADCGCNMDGSLTLQCNENGKCECKANITGEKCDRCANDNISFPICNWEGNFLVQLIQFKYFCIWSNFLNVGG